MRPNWIPSLFPPPSQSRQDTTVFQRAVSVALSVVHSSNTLVKPAFLAPPGGFEPPTCDLGTRRSEHLFDLVRAGAVRCFVRVFSTPSHDWGPLTVAGGQMAGGDC